MLNLSKFKTSFQTYGELRTQENRDIRLSLLNGQLISNLQQSASGVSARAFDKGYWGFSSFSQLNQNSLEKALKIAAQNAQFLGSRGSHSAGLVKAKPLTIEKNFTTQRARRPMNYWIDFLKSIDAIITSRFKDLQSRTIHLMALDMEKHLITSEGVEAHTLIPRAHLAVVMSKASSHGPVDYRKVKGGLGSLEDHFEIEASTLLPWLEDIYKSVSEKCNGVPAVAGEHEVILNSDLAGILAHEAVGHTTEADLVLGGSVAGENLNKMVASELVNLVDFAHTAYGETCPQPIYVDDEGTEAKDSHIIVKGELKQFMNNKETAEHFHQSANGHARAFKFSDEPLIRMRNTAILPGENTLSDLISSVEKGYYLMSPMNGQADTTGEFMFGIGKGYEIVNGKLGRPIRETTISGVAFDMLKNVTMISNEFEWESSGYCGKKQPMPVGMGGPSIKSRLHLGGQ